MHLRPSIGGLCLILALALPCLHAQTDHPASTAPITRAVAVYEWTGPLDHSTAARLIPISLFLHGQLHDAGHYLAQPIPFALQPGSLYLIQRSGETIGALALQSADSIPTPNHPLPAWFGYGRFLTLTETLAATSPPTPIPTLPQPDTTPAPKPTHKKHKKHEEQAYVTAPSTPILDDPDRPILTSNPTSASNSTPKLTTPLPPDLHQAAAISDPTNRPHESFTYTFPTPTAHDKTLQALEALAQPALTRYAAFNHLTPAPSTTPTSGPTFANATAPTLIHAQLLAYTLTPSAPPTYILTAESPLTTNGPIYITLIAQPSGPNNQPHTLLLNITDATHLDRTPRLIPIDAVDAEATGHADLLFELRSQTIRQFALYDLTNSQPQQLLLTTPIP